MKKFKGAVTYENGAGALCMGVTRGAVVSEMGFNWLCKQTAQTVLGAVALELSTMCIGLISVLPFYGYPMYRYLHSNEKGVKGNSSLLRSKVSTTAIVALASQTVSLAGYFGAMGLTAGPVGAPCRCCNKCTRWILCSLSLL